MPAYVQIDLCDYCSMLDAGEREIVASVVEPYPMALLIEMKLKRVVNIPTTRFVEPGKWVALNAKPCPETSSPVKVFEKLSGEKVTNQKDCVLGILKIDRICKESEDPLFTGFLGIEFSEYIPLSSEIVMPQKVKLEPLGMEFKTLISRSLSYDQKEPKD